MKPHTAVQPWKSNKSLVFIFACAFWLSAVMAVQAQTVVLVSTNSVWKYNDSGQDLGNAWKETGYETGTWPSGIGKFGFGDGDEATVLRQNASGSPLITAYFRTYFTVTNPAAFTQLTVRLVRDDGAVVYLNGTEVLRDNMPAGTISYSTLALATTEGSTFNPFTIPSSSLISGQNCLAVEVHQASAVSADLGFNLELLGQLAGTTNQPPVTNAPVLAGYLQRDVFTNLPGLAISDLWSSPKFPSQPDLEELVNSFETPSNWGDSYGQRVYGFVVPPVTGSYVFYLCSDDQSALYLSTDESPENISQIAEEMTWAPARSWISSPGRTNTANISAPIILEAGRRYYVEALSKEWMGGDNFGVAWKVPGGSAPTNGSPPISSQYLATYPMVPPPTNDPPTLTRGYLKREVYTNIWGLTLDVLTTNPKFPDHPDMVDLVGSFETPSQFADNYGMRVSGYLLPPITGDYTFYLASDDQGALYLSPDTNPANKTRIAFEYSFSPARYYFYGNGTNAAAKISAPIWLEAGRAYYVEALVQEGGGGDNLAVAWKKPGDSVPGNGSEPIPGQYLAYSPPPYPDTNQAPTVSITSPANGASYLAPANIAISAQAEDPDGTVQSVELLVGGTSLGTRTAPPYQWSWNNIQAGIYTLTARAQDDGGKMTLSSPVVVVVGTNTPPDPGPDQELHVIGIYSGVSTSGQSGNNQEPGHAAVVVNRPGKKVTLVLSAFDPVIWHVTLTAGIVERVILGGYYPQTVQGLEPEVEILPMYMQEGSSYNLYVSTDVNTLEFYKAKSKLHAITGLEIYSFQSDYNIRYPTPYVVDRVQNDPRLKSDYPQPVDPSTLPAINFSLAFFDSGTSGGSTRFFTQNYTLAGPAGGAQLLPALRVVPDSGGRFYYGAELQMVLKVDSQSGTAQQMSLPTGLPELSWPMGMAYDSVRDRLLLVSLGGEGYMYAYTPSSGQWSVLTSMFDRDLYSMVYHPAKDTVYAIDTWGYQMYMMRPDGVITNSVGLPYLPFGVWSSYKAELVSVGNNLLLLYAPAYSGGDYRESRMYLFDWQTQEFRLTWRQVLQAQPNARPAVQILWPYNQASLSGLTPVPLIASAVDPDGAIISVEFFAGAQNLGKARRSQTAPFDFRLDWTNAPLGTNIVTARAIDGDGSAGLSAPVFFTVNNQSPTPEPQRELHVVGIYSGLTASGGSSQNHEEGNALVNVNRPGKRVTLLLSAYEPVCWQITVGESTVIENVILAGYYPQRAVGLPPGVPVVMADMQSSPTNCLWVGYALESTEFYESVPKIYRWTGMEISSWHGGSQAGAPFVIDRVQLDARLRRDYPQAFPASALPPLSLQLAFYSGPESGPGTLTLRNYTLAGPQDSSSLLPGTLRVEPDASRSHYYGWNGNTLVCYNTQTRTAGSVSFDNSGLPELSWAMGGTFDSLRDRALLVTLGGEGYLYGYSPVQNDWFLVSSMNNVDVQNIVYHPAQDALYAMNVNWGGYGANLMYRFSPDGIMTGQIALPWMPGQYWGDYDYQLAAAGDYLVLFAASKYVSPGSQPDNRMYLINPATSQVILTYRKVGPVINVPPVVTMTSPTNGYSVMAGTPVQLVASAWDPDGALQRVEFFVNGASIGEGQLTAERVYGITWTCTNAGNFNLTARATDYDNTATTSTAIQVTLRGLPPSITAHPVSQTVFKGDTVTLSVGVIGTPPFSYYWYKNGTLWRQGSATLVLSNAQFADGGDYYVAVDNAGGRVTSLTVEVRVFPLAAEAGSLDLGFDPGSGADQAVYAVALQADGKVLIGGAFDSYDAHTCSKIARLHVDGSVDTSFAPYMGANNVVYALAVQTDGKVLVGGAFTNISGGVQPYFARLNGNGSIDSSFTPVLDGWVNAILIQPDDKIVVGGYFQTINAVPREGVARLNADGTLDDSFHPNAGLGHGGFATSLALQPDRKIIVAGYFHEVNGVGRRYVARLNGDGTLDTSFNTIIGPDSTVFSVAMQPDGKVVIGGGFHSVDGFSRNGIARLNADGTLDFAFNPGSGPGGADVGVHAVAVGLDGKILVGGWFNSFNEVRRTHLARLNNSGSLDSRFAAEIECSGWGGGLSVIVVQPDNQLLIAGALQSVNSLPRQGIALLNNPYLAEPPVILTHPASHTKFVGQNTTFTVVVAGTFPMQYQWLFDGAPINGATNSTLALQIVEPAMAGLYSVRVWNTAGTQTSGAAQLTVLEPPTGPGSMDITFDPTAGGVLPGITGNYIEVRALAMQPDGKVIAGGFFTAVNGQERAGLARFNPDGSLDPTFVPEISPETFWCETIALQPDGKVLAAGFFTYQHPLGLKTLVRFNADGSLDPTFHFYGDSIEEFYGCVMALAVLPDGGILIGGSFYEWDALSDRPESFARLNPDGSLDPTWPKVELNGGSEEGVYAIAMQSDGKILVGGGFMGATTWDEEWNQIPPPPGTVPRYLVRLNSDGTLDANFRPEIDDQWWSETPAIRRLAVQADGKILIAGSFFEVNSIQREGLARLNPDGSVDTTFVVADLFEDPYWDYGISSLLSQPDGKVLLAAYGVGLVRLNPDGGLDEEFECLAQQVNATIVQADGKIMIATSYPDVGGYRIGYLARLNNNLQPLEPPQITRAPENQIVVAGRTAFFELIAFGDNLQYQWLKNGIPLSGQNRNQLLLHRLTESDAGEYKGVVSNAAGSTSTPPATLTVLSTPTGPGSVDLTFPIALAYKGPDVDRGPIVYNLLKQPDGKVIVHGWFDYLFGVPRNHLARLLPTGELDPSFQAVCIPQMVTPTAVAVQADGKVLLGGPFYSGIMQSLLRLHPDATVDTSFTPPLRDGVFASVQALAVQPDGKILVAGMFAQSGESQLQVMRLGSSGALDSSFKAGIGFAGEIKAITVQRDEKIILIGNFTAAVEGLVLEDIVRLNGDGSWDSSFRASIRGYGLSCVAVQPNGQMLAGGWITDVCYQPENEPMSCVARQNLVRLNEDGTFDADFQAGPSHLVVHAICLQPDGKILIGGYDQSFHSTSSARLNSDGSVDASFAGGQITPEFGGDRCIRSILLQDDGQILIGGAFETYNQVYAPGLVRVNNNVVMPFVVRQLPALYVSDNPVTVRLRATAQTNVSAYAVEDLPPSGWTVGNISDGGVFDAQNGKVKFGPFFDRQTRNVSYEVTPPSGARNTVYFSGVGSADGVNITTVGDDRMKWGGPHPADVQGDYRISIAEATAYSGAWRKGSPWPVGPGSIPIDYVTRAASLWRNGESYGINALVSPPLCWVVPGEANVPAASLYAAALSVTSEVRAQQAAVYVPGESLMIELLATPVPGVSAYAVEDKYPAGWMVSSVSNGGEVDAVNGKVKWGPFMDATARRLSYRIAAPAESQGLVSFASAGSFDGSGSETIGTRQRTDTCRLTSVRQAQPGQIKLTANGRPGARLLIEASSNLRTWSALITVTNNGGAVQFPDPEAQGGKARFYRARAID